MTGIYTSTHTGTEIDKAVSLSGGVAYTTEAPTETVGSTELPQLQVAFLTSTPNSLLNGWMYVIYNSGTGAATSIIAVLSDGTRVTLK